MIALHVFTLTFFLVQFLYFFSRVVLTRSPQEIFSWTGFLCIIYFMYFFIENIYKIYRYLVPLKKSSKFQEFLTNYGIKIIHYLDVDFVQRFLSRNFWINRFFYENMLFFIKISKYLNKVLNISFIAPWLLFLFCLFFELITKNYFLLTLYTLSLWFLVRKMLLLLTWLAYHKHCQMLRYIKITYFDLWPDKVFDFFIFNRTFINSMFFTEPALENKKMLTFLWNIYLEIFYYQTVCGSIQFFFKKRVVLEKFLLKINKIILFSLLFCVIFRHLVYFTFFQKVVAICFIVFGILLISSELLNYFETDFSIVGYKTIAEFSKSHDEFLLLTKKRLLETYDFLKDSDLPLVYINKKTPKDFVLQEENPFKSCFTSEETAIFEEILERYDDFAYEQLDAGFIDPVTQFFDYEAYIKSKQNKNSST